MIETRLGDIREDLISAADAAVAESRKRFFKEGERFLCYGLKSAEVNRLAKRYVSETKELPKGDVLALWTTSNILWIKVE